MAEFSELNDKLADIRSQKTRLSRTVREKEEEIGKISGAIWPMPFESEKPGTSLHLSRLTANTEGESHVYTRVFETRQTHAYKHCVRVA